METNLFCGRRQQLILVGRRDEHPREDPTLQYKIFTK